MSDILQLIEATVRLEQRIGDSESTVGTGFVVAETRPDGSPRVVLITAHHVFDRMPRDEAQVGFRARDASQAWRYAPVSIRIRNADGHPIWTKHPTQDVAAIELPAGVAPAALPVAQLGGERVLEVIGAKPGDEMMVLGYPAGVSANRAGFPILRAGRVASYPVSPADRYPTYLLDINVFAGNSGGPVYAFAPSGLSYRNLAPGSLIVTGLLTQQIEFDGQRLAIGNVTQADFITETLSLLTGGPAPVSLSEGAVPGPQGPPASTARTPTALDRLREAWSTVLNDVAILFRRAWIVARESFLDLITKDPTPVR